jgi:hypothetical protein
MNWLLDALGDAGYALDTPGAYLRGALAGRPGERASGEELLSGYGVDAGPWGGMAAEMVLDPLAIAGPAFGAFKGVQGINRATRAAADYAAGPGLRIVSGVEGPTAFARLRRGGDSPGSAGFGAVPGHGETMAAGDIPAFAEAVRGAPVARIGGIKIDPDLKGKGLGQQMYVDAMAASPVEWQFNSQASAEAAAMYDRLAEKKLIDLIWENPPNPDHPIAHYAGGNHVMRLTPEGRALAGTGSLVHPGVLGGEHPHPLLQRLARFVGDEGGLR